MKQKFVLSLSVLITLVLAFMLAGCTPPPPTTTPTPIPTPQPPIVDLVLNPDIPDVVAGHTVILAANASGKELTFKWTAERGTLSSTTTPTVTYTAPNTSGADIVTVIVTSATGSSSKTKSFNIIVPPTESPISTDAPPELGLPIIADFDNCKGTNTLGGAMGSAYALPDSMKESYIEEPERGCVAELEYHIKGWGAFWLKLQSANLVSPYKFLAFDIKGDTDQETPRKIKVEMKRLCNVTYDNCQETSIKYISGITTNWQTLYLALDTSAWEKSLNPLSSFEQMGQLAFTVEADKSGTDGIFYLDNIRVEISH